MSEEAQIRAKLSDQWWRLNNLYWIIDKSGKRVKFTPNVAQRYFYNNMWYLCIILKARQLGFTTFIQIFMLDACLFNDNISAGVIAHNREDAENFFKKKIKYAFDNLPEWLKSELKATSDSAKELAFANGSSIRVGTSLRSGTYQYLHISEFGKICAKYPDKAEEIVSGAINTVQAGQFIFIESTAEGAYGRFYNMSQDGIANEGKDLTELDFKFFFFPWFKDPEYSLEANLVIDDEDAQYFRELESAGVELTQGQKNWYVKKKAVQKTKMRQEYPSTPEEAFQRISEHAVYGPEMRLIREEGRILSLPYSPAKQTHLFFDLGRSLTDATSIWFMQDNNPWLDLIDYEEDFKKPVGHYAKLIKEKPYNIGTVYLPHDGDHDDFELKTYADRLRALGFQKIEIVPRIAHFNDGIMAMRDTLPKCRFDEVRCAKGVIALEGYRYEYDEKDAAYKHPRHDWASHAEGALRQMATGYRGEFSGWAGQLNKPSGRGRRDKVKLGGNTDWIV